MLSTNFLLKNYGKLKKLNVKKSYSFIICYYGLRALPAPFSLVKEDLDSHFGASVVKEVEQVNNYFKKIRGRKNRLSSSCLCYWGNRT